MLVECVFLLVRPIIDHLKIPQSPPHRLAFQMRASGHWTGKAETKKAAFPFPKFTRVFSLLHGHSSHLRRQAAQEKPPFLSLLSPTKPKCPSGHLAIESLLFSPFILCELWARDLWGQIQFWLCFGQLPENLNFLFRCLFKKIKCLKN